MLKVTASLVIGLVVGTWVGADIVHREYFPILKDQAHEIETLLNGREAEIGKVKDSLALCKEEYVKQHKNGRDFVTNSLGLDPIK